MSGIINAAAQRVNTSVAGLTGQVSDPRQEPGAPQSASAVEVADLIPSEFGGLTHLFGGSGEAQQFAPVQVARDVPTGSLPGKLGGLVPDARSAVVHGVATAKANAPTVAPALSATARNYVNRARAFLKI
jgi:hypothetical protein